MKRSLLITVPTLVLLSAFSYPLLVAAMGSLAPGYSHTRDFVSELAAPGAPNAWVLQAVLIVDAAVLGAFAVMMHRLIRKNRFAALGPGTIGIFAFSLFIGGAFPCDADCRPESFAGWMHVINAIPSLFATLAGPFLIWKRLASDPEWKGFDTFAFVCGVMTIGAMVFAVAVFPVLDLTGLGQRVVLTLQLSFYAGLAVGMLRFGLQDRVAHAPTSSAATPA